MVVMPNGIDEKMVRRADGDLHRPCLRPSATTI
jgi:hypothetical protein